MKRCHRSRSISTPNHLAPGRAPHFWRASGRALYDDLGRGFTLLRIGAAAPEVSSLRLAFANRQVPLAILEITETVALEKYQHYPLVLVRPDQHIAWRATTVPADPISVVDLVTARN